MTEGSHCSVCGKVLTAQSTVNPTGHNYSDWTVVREASCSAEGSERRQCKNCGKTETQVLAKTAHKYVAGECQYCGTAQGPSECLEFALSDDGSYYVCTGVGINYVTRYPDTIVIPAYHNGKPVKEIGKMAFYYDSSLKHVVIPEGIESISASAFSGCNNLTSVTLPKSLKRINQEAFGGCGNLETLYFQTSGWKYLASAYPSSYAKEVDLSDPYATANTFRSEKSIYGNYFR